MNKQWKTVGSNKGYYIIKNFLIIIFLMKFENIKTLGPMCYSLYGQKFQSFLTLSYYMTSEDTNYCRSHHFSAAYFVFDGFEITWGWLNDDRIFSFLVNSFKAFFNSPYATSLFSIHNLPLILSYCLVNNFQMQWHGTVLVVRVHWSLCLFASMILMGEGRAFPQTMPAPLSLTRKHKPSQTNTKAIRQTHIWETHTLTHQHCSTESRFCIWTTTVMTTFLWKSQGPSYWL